MKVVGSFPLRVAIVSTLVSAWLPAPVAAGARDSLLLRVSSARLGASAVMGHGAVGESDTLAFVRSGAADTTRIPFAEIARLEVARGTQSHFWGGAGIGLLSGVALGWVVGYGQGDDETPPDCFFCLTMTAGEKGAAGAVAGGLLGSVIGGLAGLAHRTPKWVPTSAEALRITLVPDMDAPLRFAFQVGR